MTRANNRTESRPIHVREASRDNIPGIVWVSTSSILPNEDVGFGGGLGSPFHDPNELASVWKEPNIVRGEEVIVAEMEGRVVGCVTVQSKSDNLELINIDVPIELQGTGIGTKIVKSIEERAKKAGKRAVTLGTSRNAQGVAWKSLPWWQHLGYQITHEEENDWTRSIGEGVREIRMRKDLD